MMDIPNREKYITEVKEEWERNYVKCELNIKFYKTMIELYEARLKDSKKKALKKEFEDKLANVKEVLKAEEQNMRNTVEYMKIVN